MNAIPLPDSAQRVEDAIRAAGNVAADTSQPQYVRKLAWRALTLHECRDIGAIRNAKSEHA